MKERRAYERYTLRLPARLETINPGKAEVFELQTADVSLMGAFLRTTDPIPEGTRFRITLIIPSNRIKELTGTQGSIEVCGTVIRCTPKGVAICFDGKCKVLSLNPK